MGAAALLVDEDTCATNFMIRDDKMMQLVAIDKEPITPFVRKVRALYEELNISSILVIGGSGDYFDVADYILMMDCYKCYDVTERAKQIVASSNTGIQHEASSSVPFGSVRSRHPICEKFRPDGKVSVRAKNVVSFADIELDLSGLEQLVSKPQTIAISLSLQKVATLSNTGDVTLPELLAVLQSMIDKEGLDTLAPSQFNGSLARPRSIEIAGAINRLRRDGTIVQKK